MQYFTGRNRQSPSQPRNPQRSGTGSTRNNSSGGGGGGNSSSSYSSMMNSAMGGSSSGGGDGRLSPRSRAAVVDLDKYERELLELKEKLGEFSHHLSTGSFSHSDLTHMKNELAQLNGTLEKLQFNSIDSIVSVDLISGKDQVKAKRKGLNSECERVRVNINEMNGVITALLADGR